MCLLFLSNVQGEWKLRGKTPPKNCQANWKAFYICSKKKKMLGTGLKSFPYLPVKGYLSSTTFHLRFTFYPIPNACQVYGRSQTKGSGWTSDLSNGQQILLQYIHLSKTLIFLPQIIFPQKLESSLVYLFRIQ